MLPIAFATIRVVSVVVYLNAQENAAKQAFRTADSKEEMSNSAGGAKRFTDTGSLILEPSYVLDPSKMKQRRIFNMRLNPRVSRMKNDGWVGMYNGHWYVKIY